MKSTINKFYGHSPLWMHIELKTILISLTILFMTLLKSNDTNAQKDFIIHIEEFDLKTDGWHPYVEFWMGIAPQSDSQFTAVGPDQVCNKIVFKNQPETLGGLRLYFRIRHSRWWWLYDGTIFQPPHTIMSGAFPKTIQLENNDVKIKLKVEMKPGCTGAKFVSGDKINENKRLVENPVALPGDIITTNLLIDVNEDDPPETLHIYEQVPKHFILESSEPPAEVITETLFDEGIPFDIQTLYWQFTGSDISDKELLYTMSAPDSLGRFHYAGYIQLDDGKLNFTGAYQGFISEFIPTLSEWGVIILILLTLAVGMVFLYRRETALALAGNIQVGTSASKPKLFDKYLYAKVFGVILLIGLALLGVSYLYFGEITSADPFGTFVSSAIVAYMIHFWMLKKTQSE